jgi:hypothetical protein
MNKISLKRNTCRLTKIVTAIVEDLHPIAYSTRMCKLLGPVCAIGWNLSAKGAEGMCREKLRESKFYTQRPPCIYSVFPSI